MSIWLVFSHPSCCWHCTDTWKNSVLRWKERTRAWFFANVLNRDICLEHRVRTLLERCCCLPAFFFRADWLDLRLLSSRELGKDFLFLIYLWRIHLCGEFVFPSPRHHAPILWELWSCPSSIVILGPCLVLFHPPTAPPTLSGGPGLRKQTQSRFLSISFRIFSFWAASHFQTQLWIPSCTRGASCPILWKMLNTTTFTPGAQPSQIIGRFEGQASPSAAISGFHTDSRQISVKAIDWQFLAGLRSPRWQSETAGSSVLLTQDKHSSWGALSHTVMDRRNRRHMGRQTPAQAFGAI